MLTDSEVNRYLRLLLAKSASFCWDPASAGARFSSDVY